MRSGDSLAPRWLAWAREIQALAQTGHHYAVNDYQRERYARLTAIAAEILAEHCELSPDSLETVFRLQDGYATPRVDVRAAVFKEGKILLVREVVDGGWTLPGGWADVGDAPAYAAEREVWEEAGFTVRASRLVGVYDGNRFEPLELFHAYKLVFLCDLLEGEARTSQETSAIAFFGLDDIPVNLSSERTGLRHIQAAFRLYEHPELPTEFDR